MTAPTRPNPRVLVIEDEGYVRRSLEELLRSQGYDPLAAATAEEGLQILERAPIDLVLTDLRMPGEGGLPLVRRIRGRYPEVPVIVLTGYGTIASAVECVRAGASDYLLKPAQPEALSAAFERALAERELKRELAYLRDPSGGLEDEKAPTGDSPAWRRVMDQIRAAAPADSTVLLLGESGTGKEMAARLVHRLSGRSERPYVRVNCAAVPLEMWESEFFGHRRGAFTGAAADREGRFRVAHRGTLFMDEIGAMPMPAQAKILRVLQDGEFQRIGEEQTTRVNVRVVAATNSDLEAEVAAGRFREDLYYRLDVMRIELPPLRDRPEDIPKLAARFLKEVSVRLGRPVPEVTARVLQALSGYRWPGNVRELRNVLERALILNPGPVLDSLELPGLPGRTPEGERSGREGRAGSTGERSAAAWAVAAGGEGAELNLRSNLATCERDILVEAMRRARGVRKEAARMLGIDQRNLAYYLRKHGIDPDAP